MNSDGANVKDVYISEDQEGVSLVVEHQDETKRSATLRSASDSIDFGTATIEEVRRMLDLWSQQRIPIAEGYVKDKVNDYAFLYDAIALARYVELLNSDAENLLNVGDSTTLMHNRVIAQLMYEYETLGCSVDSRPANYLPPRKHDFNVAHLRCEVKTVQTLGKLERFALGGQCLTETCHMSLMASLRDDLENAKEQVGKDGMIVLSFWSYKLNGILESYFRSHTMLLRQVPPPAPNTTILALVSGIAFQDYYVAFTTDRVQNSLENIFTTIQHSGVHNVSFHVMQDGLVISLSTAAIKGSSVDFSFPID